MHTQSLQYRAGWIGLCSALLWALFPVALAIAAGPGAACARNLDCDDGLACAAGICSVLVQNQPNAMRLMQEFGNGPGVVIGTGLNVFKNYFDEVWPWLLGVCAGLAVLQGVAGGIEIMWGGTPELKSRGGERLMWALAGLLMLALSGIILNFLNPGYYTLR